MTSKKAGVEASPGAKSVWYAETQKRIDEQAALVATLEPNSRAHRTAVALHLLFQDSLHVLSETENMLRELRFQRTRRDG